MLLPPVNASMPKQIVIGRPTSKKKKLHPHFASRFPQSTRWGSDKVGEKSKMNLVLFCESFKITYIPLQRCKHKVVDSSNNILFIAYQLRLHFKFRFYQPKATIITTFQFVSQTHRNKQMEEWNLDQTNYIQAVKAANIINYIYLVHIQCHICMQAPSRLDYNMNSTAGNVHLITINTTGKQPIET